MSFRIRPAQPGDATAIAHVQVESWRSTYRGIVPDAFLEALDKNARAGYWDVHLTDPATPILIAEDGAGIFGFISGGAIRDAVDSYEAELYAIYLLKTHQKQGAGRALIRDLAAALHAQGFENMIVWALEANPAVEFYKRLGAVPLTSKSIHIGGKDLPEMALGWPDLASLLQAWRPRASRTGAE
jgi:GNAT superfamily N-acetyltransferase